MRSDAEKKGTQLSEEGVETFSKKRGNEKALHPIAFSQFDLT